MVSQEKLREYYQSARPIDRNDVEAIRQMTIDYPFYNLPYIVLAKYYHDEGHYKYEGMLRQAAMRVSNRRELYDYINGSSNAANQTETAPVSFNYAIGTESFIEAKTLPEIEEIQSPEIKEETYLSPLAEFLQEQNTEEKLPDFNEDVIEEEPIELKTELYSNEEIISEFNEHGVEDISEGEEVAETEVQTFISDKEEVPDAALLEFLGDEVITESNKPEEFEFIGNRESVQEIEPTDETVAEEVEAEFSFSKSFNNPETEVQTEERTIPELAETKSETIKSEHLQSDNPFKEEPVIEIVPEFSLEESDNSERDFFAWLKHPHYEKKNDPDAESPEETAIETQNIIDRFIQNNPQISRPKKEFFNPENMAKRSEVLDLEYVTETLAQLYYDQANYNLAIRAYEKLSLQNPAKEAYFADLIQKIRLERK